MPYSVDAMDLMNLLLSIVSAQGIGEDIGGFINAVLTICGMAFYIVIVLLIIFVLWILFGRGNTRG